MANFDYLKAQIAARIHDNTEQEITAEDVRRSFNDTIDAINAAKEDEGAVAPASWGGITGTLSAQTDLQAALNGKQAVIADLSTIRSGAAAGATAYQKPSGGIPKTDLNNGVQSSLNKADSAYQKPGTGIPKGDLASGVQTSLGKADTAYQKPNNGIPKSDLAYAVQTSLGKADSAVQPGSLAAVATSGSYNDLTNKPTIPAAPGTLNTNNSTAQSVSSSEALSGTVKLHKVSKTGSYNDLTNKPTIPAAQVQSDWNEADNTKPAYIKNKPAIPPGVVVDQVYDPTSANAQSGVAMAGALAGKEDTISDLATIRSGAAAGATAYQLPSGGIPGTDLDNGVRSDLNKARSAVQPGDLALVASTGDYDDLTDKPTIPSVTLNGSATSSPSFYAPTTAGTQGQVLVSNGSGAPTWQAAPSGGGDVTDVTLGGTSVVDGNGVAVLPAYPVVPTLATVATTGDYDDLLNRPTIPTVPTAYDLTPSPLGAASAGASDDWARGDHAHAMPSAADVGAIASPVGGTTGQVLRKTASGAEWDDESVATDLQVQNAVDSYLDDHPTLTGTFSNTAKRALLTLLEKVAYIDQNGQTYLDNLEAALFAVEVDSITAVFTQGANTVYDTDPLNSLKAMLVVTAEYSDQTTAVLSDSDYTLTGTLTVGTSTIMVNYGGVTDTFTVTVSAGYVTSGLIAYWDGINNTGNGHDPTAAAWTDIVNGYVFEFQNSSGRQWNADNLELSSGQRGLYGSPKFWTVSENCTIECVIAPSAVRSEVLAMFDPNSSASTMPTGTQAREFCLYSDNTVGFKALKDYTYTLPSGVSDLTGIRKLAAVYNNYTVTAAKINNVTATTGSAQHSYGQFGPNKFRLAEYADTAGSSAPYYGKIYAVRVYNKALTDAELTQNFNYDNAVYSLGL